MEADILITDTMILPDPGKNTSIPDGCIAILKDKIIYAGPMAQYDGRKEKHTIDGHGMLTMPGLINLHGHAPMTLFRGLADDLELADWLTNHIFPAEAEHVNPEMAYWCSSLAAAEMILSGTTTTADGYFHEHDVARAFAEAGLRAVAAQGIIDFPAPGVPDPGDNITAAASFINTWQEKNALIRPALFAHSPYTCSNATLQRAKQLARKRGVQLYIHVAETEHEYSIIRDPLGKTPIQHLHALGILDTDTICVHCVWSDDQDIDILAGQGSPVILCPQSNLKLASGMANLPLMLAKGIRVGLGTDGCASNNSLDMFREMDICAKVQKLHNLDPVAVPANRILEIATTKGALISGFPGHDAILAPGNPADLIMLDIGRPHLTPLYSSDLLVYAASGADVRTVIIDGQLVLNKGKLLTIDLKEVLGRVRSLAKSVRG
jgi:5-methylthioadenosine/S-adenosylhomocysteine deaminase